MPFFVGVVIEPVYQVAATRVESSCVGLENRMVEFETTFYRLCLLRYQSAVSHVVRISVVEVGKGRHTGGFAPRGIKADVIIQSVRGVDGGVEIELIDNCRIVVEQPAQGECYVSEDKIVFGKIADVVSGVGFGVFADSLFERFAQYAAHYRLVAKLAAKTGDTEFRGILHIEIHPENIASVVIVVGIPAWRVGCSFADKLENIEMAVPIDLGDEFELTSRFAFYGNKVRFGIVVLVGIFGRIERVGAVVFGVYPCLKIYRRTVVNIKSALPKDVQNIVIAVGDVSVGMFVSCRDTMNGRLCFVRPASFGSEKPVHTAFELAVEVGLKVFFGNNVDSSRKGACAKSEGGGSLNDFDAFDVGKVDGDIETVMSGLGIGQVNAVEEDGCLVE